MSLPIVLNVTYQSQPVRFTGKVVGFSDRISSVLVPQNFLATANKQFGTQGEARSSRVVIKTNDPGNPELVKYLKDNGLVTDADKTRFSQYRKIVNTVVNASWLTGAVMLLFALLVFSLFIQLTIASTKSEINLLVTIGASPKQLQRFLMKQFLPSNIIITLACLATITILQYLLQAFLSKQNMFVSQWISYYTIAAAVIILVVLWLVNYMTIKKYIKETEK
jgi:cell division protein FtsX